MKPWPCLSCKYEKHIDQGHGYGIVCVNHNAPYVRKTTMVQLTVGAMTAENALVFCRGFWYKPTRSHKVKLWFGRVFKWL